MGSFEKKNWPAIALTSYFLEEIVEVLICTYKYSTWVKLIKKERKNWEIKKMEE